MTLSDLKRLTVRQRTPFLVSEAMRDEGIEFISGKWFRKAKEIEKIDRYLLSIIQPPKVDIIDDAIDYFIRCYGSMGLWYPLPIIEEARAAEPAKLCYPLCRKQLVIINYLLRHDEEIFFILTGVGGSGKSTFANIICQIFDNDTSSLNLSELSDPYMLATGITHRLIYSDELNSDEINGGKLKQLFSNQVITINGKYQTPYQTRCQSAFFFNCNIAPRLDLCDTGMMRRTLYYAMNEKIKNPDKTLNKKEWTHQDLVNIVAHALQVDMTNWQELFKDETREYLVKANSVYIMREFSHYPQYSEACKESGLKPYSEPKWQEIRKLLEEWDMLGPSLPHKSTGTALDDNFIELDIHGAFDPENIF